MYTVPFSQQIDEKNVLFERVSDHEEKYVRPSIVPLVANMYIVIYYVVSILYLVLIVFHY